MNMNCGISDESKSNQVIKKYALIESFSGTSIDLQLDNNSIMKLILEIKILIFTLLLTMNTLSV